MVSLSSMQRAAGSVVTAGVSRWVWYRAFEPACAPEARARTRRSRVSTIRDRRSSVSAMRVKPPLSSCARPDTACAQSGRISADSCCLTSLEEIRCDASDVSRVRRSALVQLPKRRFLELGPNGSPTLGLCALSDESQETVRRLGIPHGASLRFPRVNLTRAPF
jgi:hypothetical protein